MPHARAWIPVLAVLLAGCAGPPPRAAELPLRDPGTCRLENLRDPRGLDVAIVIDASRSTSRPSGLDIDMDGQIGTLFNAGTSDPHDSLLAAQVSAVRSLVDAIAALDVRVSIVSFSGRTDNPTEGRETPLVHWQRGRIRADLTDDPAAIERALDAVMATGGQGTSDFAAGMQLAVRTLIEAPEAPTPRQRAIFLIADSPVPIVAGPNPLNQPGLAIGMQRSDPRMRLSALRAIRAEARIHTFAIGPASTSEVPHALTRIAGATGGLFRIVDDPARLHCELLDALTPRPAQAGGPS